MCLHREYGDDEDHQRNARCLGKTFLLMIRKNWEEKPDRGTGILLYAVEISSRLFTEQPLVTKMIIRNKKLTLFNIIGTLFL